MPEVERQLAASGFGPTNVKQVNIRKGLKTSDGRRKTFTNKFSGTRDHFMKANNTANSKDDEQDDFDKFDKVRTTKIVRFLYLLC